MHYPIDRIAHTMAFVTQPAREHWLEQEITLHRILPYDIMRILERL